MPPGPSAVDRLVRPPRSEGEYVITVGISQESGDAILTSLDAGDQVVGRTAVDAVVENRTTYNVIAQTKGGDQSNVLAVGAHSDAVYAGPGINDDGSGTIGILEVAEQLSKYKTNNAIRFGWWVAEEFGMLGSEYYVSTLSEEEANKIRLYINFDMIASPNFIYAIYDGDGSAFNLSGLSGSAEAGAFFETRSESQSLPSQPTELNGRSDYRPFLDANIAAGGLSTGAEEKKTEEEAAIYGGMAGIAYDPNHHEAGDTYDNLNFEAFLTNASKLLRLLLPSTGLLSRACRL